MSFLETTTSSRTWLPILGILEDDPYRSRNTIAHAQSAYCARLFRESTYLRSIGEGAVFQVYLYQHGSDFYAVKKAKPTSLEKSRTKNKDVNTGGIFSALKEIQVISNSSLQRHPNIVDILGWDWGNDGVPVLFVEYAERSSLRDFLRENGATTTTSEKRSFALDIACGLNALHAADIAHGDIKLANTLIFPDTRGVGGLIAKVSDFSHSIFGISSRRSTTYPGSSLYNAPEVRTRDAIIPSDRLPKCESFSYGLLVWEIIKNGETFFDPSWVSWSTDSETKPDVCGHLQTMKRDGIYDRAHKFLCHIGGERERYHRALFYQVFDFTLRDDPKLRKDMHTIAIALDYCDSADIVRWSTTEATCAINVWWAQEFNPLDNEPWLSKVQFVNDLRNFLNEPAQPNHGEYHILLARCHAESYGALVDSSQATSHLYESARLGSLEASWMIEIMGRRLHPDPAIPSLAHKSDLVSTIARRIAKSETIAQTLGQTPNPPHRHGPPFMRYVHEWNLENSKLGRDSGFTGSDLTAYRWTRESVEQSLATRGPGDPICDLIVSFSTILKAKVNVRFFEAMFSLGLHGILDDCYTLELETCDYTATSYGKAGEFWLQQLISATRGGHMETLLWLLDRIDNALETRQYGHLALESATGESPLHHLANINQPHSDLVPLIQRLTRIGVDINGQMSSRLWASPHGVELTGTPLQTAIRFRSLSAARALVEAGAKTMFCQDESHLCPLRVAAGMHCPDIMRYLIQQCEEPSRRGIIKSIGIPTRRGWFDTLISDLDYEVAGESVLRTIAGLFSDDTNTSILDIRHWNKTSWFIALDGTPLVEAVMKGQRNPRIIAILIECGLGPTTMAGRWKLLSSVLSIAPQDPWRSTLLALLFRRRLVDQAGLLQKFESVDPWSSLSSSWCAGWSRFFRRFRNPDEGPDHGLPVLHLLVRRGDYDAIAQILRFFPHTVAAGAALAYVDSQGLTPVQVAVREHKGIYKLMQEYHPSRLNFRLRRRLTISHPLVPIANASKRDREILDTNSQATGPGTDRNGQFGQQSTRYIQPGLKTGRESNPLYWQERRRFEMRLYKFLNQGFGEAIVIEAFEDYAVWVQRNDLEWRTKAAHLCVVANIFRHQSRVRKILIQREEDRMARLRRSVKQPKHMTMPFQSAVKVLGTEKYVSRKRRSEMQREKAVLFGESASPTKDDQGPETRESATTALVNMSDNNHANAATRTAEKDAIEANSTIVEENNEDVGVSPAIGGDSDRPATVTEDMEEMDAVGKMSENKTGIDIKSSSAIKLKRVSLQQKRIEEDNETTNVDIPGIPLGVARISWSVPPAWPPDRLGGVLSVRAAAIMLVRAYKEIEFAPPAWIPMDRERRSAANNGFEAILEFYQEGWFREIGPWGDWKR